MLHRIILVHLLKRQLFLALSLSFTVTIFSRNKTRIFFHVGLPFFNFFSLAIAFVLLQTFKTVISMNLISILLFYPYIIESMNRSSHFISHASTFILSPCSDLSLCVNELRSLYFHFHFEPKSYLLQPITGALCSAHTII